ncbi:uncharacterized protein LOC111316868 [Durio zibethinus]|uniref:Uncharacterized protein LOC111316868 n=1 Tax=Durio zibethinus TaxID=66656 RepID=A0A6P6BCH0_DURZI|nr:uncharacterized protein LOC111316868 [Durio zibethinus]
MDANGMGKFGERGIDSVVCPKPRRLGVFNSSAHDHIGTCRWPTANYYQMADSKAGSELLDIILAKGSYGIEKPISQVDSSPPFFCGSPPSRASNPVIQDAQFNNEKLLPPLSSPAPASPSSRIAGGGCVRMKFGNKPAAVRIEGFDCLSIDRRNCSISAVA